MYCMDRITIIKLPSFKCQSILIPCIVTTLIWLKRIKKTATKSHLANAVCNLFSSAEIKR